MNLSYQLTNQQIMYNQLANEYSQLATHYHNQAQHNLTLYQQLQSLLQEKIVQQQNLPHPILYMNQVCIGLEVHHLVQREKKNGRGLTHKEFEQINLYSSVQQKMLIDAENKATLRLKVILTFPLTSLSYLQGYLGFQKELLKYHM